MSKTRATARPLPLVNSIDEAVQQALLIAEARECGHHRAELRKSNSSVQEWVLVPTPRGPVFVSAKMGGHRWDSLEAYYRWHHKGLLGGDGVRAFLALGARPALPGEAEIADVEAQIGQRTRKDAKVMVLPGGAAAVADASRSVTAALVVPDAGQDAGGPRTAKLFRSGRAQLVHLPDGFRFDGEAVRIRRHGAAVVLEPIAEDWAWLDAFSGEPLDEDFQRAAEDAPGEAPERPEVDRFFR